MLLKKKEYSQLYKPFKRLFKGPAFADSVFETYENLADHIISNNSVYDGEIFVVIKPVPMLYIYKDYDVHAIVHNIVYTSEGTVSLNNNEYSHTDHISANVKISHDAGNAIRVREDGLYVATPTTTTSPSQPESNTSSLNKKVALIGDGTNTEFVVNHGFNTTDLFVNIWTNTTPHTQVYADVESLDDGSAIRVIFEEAPLQDQYKVVIMG